MEITVAQRKDQYEQYIAEGPIDALDEEDSNANDDGIVIPYWRGVEYKWPELARFAFDALYLYRLCLPSASAAFLQAVGRSRRAGP